MIGDGAPTEAATRRANGDGYLDAHCRRVVRALDHDTRVSVGAITLDRSVERIFANHVHVDLEGTLTLSDYAVLERLFVPGR